MKYICVVVLTGLLVLTAAGCNTVKGFGKDISTVGHWFTRGAD